MDKLAQERGIFNKLREKANVTGRILESLNPEFHDMMEKLRLADEKIREHAVNAKELVRSAKSLVRRRDYLAAAVNLSAFHERSRYIGAELERFLKGVNLKHYQFLLDQFDDEQKEQLFGYDPNAELSMDEASVDDVPEMVAEAALRKQAGLSDWWFKITDPIADLAHNVTTQRGVAMRALEKRFSIAFLKQLKGASNVMVARAEQFLSFLLRTFKKLAAALAKRNVDQYASAAKEYINRFARFHTQFSDFYKTNVVPLKERYNEIQEQARAAEERKSRALEEGAEGERERAEKARQPKPSMQEGIPSVPYSKLYEPSGKPEGAPSIEPPHAKPTPSIPESFRQRQWPKPSFQFTKQEPNPMFEGEEELPYDQNQPFDLVRRRSLDFIDTLQKHASSEDPRALVMEILRYSAELEEISPKESLQLLAVAEGIIEDYKTAGIFDWLKKDEEKPAEQKVPLV